MEKMTYKEYQKALKEVGVSYLGSFNQSAKMVLNGKNGVITYSLYLAPWKLASGNGLTINTCPSGSHCQEFCLNGSGHNKADILVHGIKESRINQARIKKTRLFYQNKALFMRMLVFELEAAMRYAEKRDMGFSVRLNCTSDLSPLAFRLEGKNILDMYPDVIFYDYTKVPGRYAICEKYPNYHLTFSYDGYNWDTCVEFLNRGINIAVVFESDVMPISWRGYRCIDMTKSDLRYMDAKSNDGVGFCGFLHFHRPASLYKSGKYERPNTPFVVMEDDAEVVYAFRLGKSTEE